VFGTRKYYFPTFEFYRQIGEERINNLSERYFSNSEVRIEPTDTVFEVGAFVGVTTAMAAEQGDTVIALGASPRNYRCAKKNITNDDVTLLNKAAWNEEGEIEINYGTKAYDDSFLSPDHGSAGVTEQVPANTIENIVSEIGIDSIDFLKVEAEGVEPEVVEGIGTLDMDKVVVSCTDERDGESPVDEVTETLRKKGYAIVEFNKQGFLFARKER